MGERYIGWLSADGELVKCDGHAHLAVALKIAKRLYGSNDEARPDDVLLQHGWLRISRLIYGEDNGIIFFTPKVMSEVQRSFLRDLFDDDAKAISRKGLYILCKNNIVFESEIPH